MHFVLCIKGLVNLCFILGMSVELISLEQLGFGAGHNKIYLLIAYRSPLISYLLTIIKRVYILRFLFHDGY